MASSSSVYGNCKEVSFREDIIVDYAISPYAATKKAKNLLGYEPKTTFEQEIANFIKWYRNS